MEWTNAQLKDYSRVPNKRVGGNKHVGRKNLQNLLNMQVGINVQVGKSGKSNK